MATSISISSEAASYCDPCQQIYKTTTNAVYFCADCRHELCSNCEVYHRKTLLTRNHRLTKLQAIDDKESGFQVSERQPGRKAANAGSVKGSDQSTDITKSEEGVTLSAGSVKGKKKSTSIIQRMRGLILSTGSGTSSTADRAGRVFKTVSLKKRVNVSSESDAWPCFITGIVLLQDRMIVSDPANSKLKVFDADHTFQFEHKCCNRPNDIYMVDNTTIVATSVRKIKVLSVGHGNMLELVNIHTEYPCYGVCCHDGKIYCVVLEKLNSKTYSEVREYIPDGTLTRKFDNLSDGNVDCNDLAYITVNPKTGTLYVTDWDKGVMALTTSGHVTAVMSPPQLNGPTGIAVDDHGQIYVCGANSNNVVQMSADGSRVEELLSNSPRFKGAQCVKIYGNKMFFTRRRSDTVFIYELS